MTVTDRPADRRVDVQIDGKPFTSYIYPESVKRPVLFPIRAASGAIVTRGGYGLFAANPFGRQGYDPKQQPVTLTLAPGQAITFRYRILVLDSHLRREQLQQEFDRYLADGKR